ncbi:polysaccharide biosynthesis C-terminal domain-containing protein [Bacillus coahuilensis]|uniref:polysaccharide biosynthesis C-terminal domain-containing protein n=1 Tax=Bacillus coahuilensis TaxID=408580 RepID=UPI000493F3B7
MQHSFLVIGFSLNAIQQIAYEYLLASGITKINTIQTLANIPYVLIITPIFIKNFGLLGAAISFLIQMTISAFVYLYVFNKVSLKGSPLWIIKDILSPLSISIIIAFLTKSLANLIGFSIYETLIVAIMMGIITLFILFLLFDYNNLVSTLKTILKRFKDEEYSIYFHKVLKLIHYYI